MLRLLAALALFLPALASAAPSLVSFSANVPPGTIVIRERQRALYLVLEGGQAIRYRVAVPKAAMAWSGYARVNGKHLRPAWMPPAVVKQANPQLPDYIPGGHPSNPMGAAALTLDRDEIAIHGTTQAMRSSIGTSASFGCIRMLNEDVLDLFQRVHVGTPVLLAP